MQKEKTVAKDVRSAFQLEQELQIAFAQKCVAVLDIYSSEWGNCRAITETFQRLKTEAGDDLRFFTVECNAVLDSLKQPEDAQRRSNRPKNIDAMRDTLSEAWQPVLDERRGKSEPYFLFYKEGKKANAVQGVNTPLIRSIVKDLCTVKTPASEFITNAKLQEIWDEHFNPEESEVALDKFLKAITTICKLTVSLTEEEKSTLLDAVGAPKTDGKQRVVHAEGLQKWFGEDENRTIQQAFTETLPEYEDRAAQVRLEREAEEKRRQEEEAERKAAEEKKAKEKADERPPPAETKTEAAAVEKSPEAQLRELNGEIEDLERKLGAAVTDQPLWRDSELPKKLERTAAAVGRDVSKAEPRFIKSTAKIEGHDAAAAAAQAALSTLMQKRSGFVQDVGGDAPLLPAKARDELHERTTHVQKLGLAKLAAAMLTYNADEYAEAFGSQGPDYSAIVAGKDLFRGSGDLEAIAKAFVVSAASFSSVPIGDLYFIGDPDGLVAQANITLDPLVPLYVDPAQAPPGSVAIKVTGVQSIIDTRGVGRFPRDEFCLNGWFAAGTVVEHEGQPIEIHLQLVPAEDDWLDYCAAWANVVREEDELCRDVLALYTKRAERRRLTGSSDEAAPAASNKSPTPTEEKPPAAASTEQKRPSSGDKAPTPAPAPAAENEGQPDKQEAAAPAQDSSEQPAAQPEAPPPAASEPQPAEVAPADAAPAESPPPAASEPQPEEVAPADAAPVESPPLAAAEPANAPPSDDAPPPSTEPAPEASS